MEKGWVKFLVSLTVTIWKTSSATVKVGFTVASFFIVAIYTVITFWAATKAGLIAAYDDRWYTLEKEMANKRSENVALINSSIMELRTNVVMLQDGQKIMRSDIHETRQDIRDMRNFLLNSRR